jgi:hypothetical protein
MTTCNFACWMVSRPMTRSGRDWDNSAFRLVSRSSSELVSVESLLLTLSVSSDMGAKGGLAEADALGSQSQSHTSFSLMNEGDQVAEFYQRELAQALNEQAFGISRSEIIHCNENEAEATITLLEGNTINVVLSSAGYKVWRRWSCPS